MLSLSFFGLMFCFFFVFAVLRLSWCLPVAVELRRFCTIRFACAARSTRSASSVAAAHVHGAHDAYVQVGGIN